MGVYVFAFAKCFFNLFLLVNIQNPLLNKHTCTMTDYLTKMQNVKTPCMVHASLCKTPICVCLE